MEKRYLSPDSNGIMGIIYDLELSFHLGRSPMDDADSLLELCRIHSFDVAPFDDDAAVDYTLGLDDQDQVRSNASVDDLTVDAAREDVSSITFNCRFDGINCELALIESDDEFHGPEIFVHSFGKSVFDKRDGLSVEDVQERADRLVDFVADVATEFDAWYAFAVGSDLALDSSLPGGRPPESGVSTLGWVTVFDESWDETLDGLDRLLDAPAYETRALDGHGVLLRKSDLPEMVDEVDEGPPFSTREYVFEGLTPEIVETEIAAEERKAEFGERTHRDPFRTFRDGEVGSDVVLCQYDAPFDVDAVDYDVFPEDVDIEDRCFVLAVRREGDALYGAENDEFLRRLVDDDGDPIGDLPPDWPSEHEMLSLAIASDSLTGFGPRWFYMPAVSEDHSSALGELLGLQVVSDEMSLWDEIESRREEAG